MNQGFIIARASRGEPLKRVVVSTGKKLVYISAPEYLDAVRDGDSEAVGFPTEDIFLYNPEVYTILQSEWELQGATRPETWRALSRYSARV